MPTPDNDSNAATFDATSPKAWSHTIGGGADRALLVYLILVDDTVQPGPTYNSVAMSLLGSRQWEFGGSQHKIWLFELHEASLPAAGSYDVSFTHTAIAVCGGAFSASVVHQTTPFGSVASANGTASPATVDVTAAVNDLVVDGVTWRLNGSSGTVGGGQTELWNLVSGNYFLGQSREDGAPSVTMSWTSGGTSDTWGIIAVALKPAGAGAGATGGAFAQTILRSRLRTW